MRRIAAVATLALIAGLAGCSGGQESGSATSTAAPAPETQAMSVRLVDNVPMNGFQNIDDRSCAPTPAFVEPGTSVVDPQVTVKDASGTIVATKIVDSNGPKTDDGCQIDVGMGSIPKSDFYTVIFRDPYGDEHSQDVQNPGDTGLNVTVTF